MISPFPHLPPLPDASHLLLDTGFEKSNTYLSLSFVTVTPSRGSNLNKKQSVSLPYMFARSVSPHGNDYDFTLRHERSKLFLKVLKEFDNSVMRTAQSMRDATGSLSQVSQSYQELSMCISNTNPSSVANREYQTRVNSQLVTNYGAQLQKAAQVFSGEMEKLHNGAAYNRFNDGVHKLVLQPLHEVEQQAKRTCDAGDDVAKSTKKLTAAKKEVERKEAKYRKLNKPITESKLYPKHVALRDECQHAYDAKLAYFDRQYESLMQQHLFIAGRTMDEFLDLNTKYMAQTMQVMGCLAPHGAETVEEMMVAGNQIGQRMGVAPQLRLGRNSIGVLGGTAPLRAVGGKGSTTGVPAPATAAAAGPVVEVPPVAVDDVLGRTSAHNFTAFYHTWTDDAKQNKMGNQTALTGAGAGDRGSEEGPRTARIVAEPARRVDLTTSGGDAAAADYSGPPTPVKPAPLAENHNPFGASPAAPATNSSAQATGGTSPSPAPARGEGGGRGGDVEPLGRPTAPAPVQSNPNFSHPQHSHSHRDPHTPREPSAVEEEGQEDENDHQPASRRTVVLPPRSSDEPEFSPITVRRQAVPPPQAPSPPQNINPANRGHTRPTTATTVPSSGSAAPAAPRAGGIARGVAVGPSAPPPDTDEDETNQSSASVPHPPQGPQRGQVSAYNRTMAAPVVRHPENSSAFGSMSDVGQPAPNCGHQSHSASWGGN